MIKKCLKMLQKGYDKNEEDGLIYDLCEYLDVDLSKVAPIIEETETAISECFGKYERLISDGL